MIADKKASAAAEREYNAASKIAPLPAAEASAPKAKRTPQVEEAIQEMQDAKMRKRISDMGYAKGGSVKSSASRRADGIAQRGKTRGKMM